jgi:hypothetical protein
MVHCAVVVLINLASRLMGCDGLANMQGLLPVKHRVMLLKNEIPNCFVLEHVLIRSMLAPTFAGL